MVARGAALGGALLAALLVGAWASAEPAAGFQVRSLSGLGLECVTPPPPPPPPARTSPLRLSHFSLHPVTLPYSALSVRHGSLVRCALRISARPTLPPRPPSLALHGN